LSADGKTDLDIGTLDAIANDPAAVPNPTPASAGLLP
jgi:hypothetical protein